MLLIRKLTIKVNYLVVSYLYYYYYLFIKVNDCVFLFELDVFINLYDSN